MNIILYEDKRRNQLLPITFTRALFDIRVGILTIREKWSIVLTQDIIGVSSGVLTKKYPCSEVLQDTIFLNGAFFPNTELVEQLQKLETNEILKSPTGEVVAAKLDTLRACTALALMKEAPAGIVFFDLVQQETSEIRLNQIPRSLNKLSDTFSLNGIEIVEDFALLTQNKKSEPITDVFTKVYAPEQVFVEPGVEIRSAIINASKGPVYIGKHAEIQENAVIIGPASIGEHVVINIGAKIRQDTTIGPYCKIGGEVSNVVFQAYSNKAHDGFLGNSFIGEWCNLGADTNNSNLKNNYSSVKLYSHVSEQEEDTGLTFCGLIMGDHSKAGINTMFNTGTVVGVCANIFDASFPPKFIPSFAWGGAQGFETFRLEKAFEVAQKMMSRRKVHLEETDKQILTDIFEATQLQRNSKNKFA